MTVRESWASGANKARDIGVALVGGRLGRLLPSATQIMAAAPFSSERDIN